MKQTTLKKLFIAIFCSLTLHSTIPQLLYAEGGKKEVKNGIKIELEGSVTSEESDLSIEGNYKIVLSDDPSSAFQYLQSKIKFKNIASDKIINDSGIGSIRASWNNSGVDFAKTLTKKLLEEVSIKTNPILVLEDKQLILKVGLEEVKFGPYKRSAVGLNVVLDKLPYDMKLGLGFYSDILNNYTKFHIPIEFIKKGLLSEEDSLKLNMTFATDGTTYYVGHNRLTFAQSILKRFGGISVAYETKSKEDILKSLSLSCSSVIMGTGVLVKNKPSAKIEAKLNGSQMRDFGFSALYDMLPEKTKELCGRLDTINISLINHFRKKRIALYDDRDQVRARFLEHVTLGFTLTFKDVCQIKDTEFEIGCNFRVVKPEHNSRVSFVVKFSKKFNVI